MAQRALAVAGYSLAVTTLLTAAGCLSWQRDARHEREANTQLVKGYQEPSVENGIVAQHTLYPYHFKPGSAVLTPVGERDVNVLAKHYRQYPGPLNVARGGASEDLYRARVETVRASLSQQGVDVARVTWVDELPGGPGMSSERVMQALESEREAGDRGAGGTGMRYSDSGGRRRPSAPPSMPQPPATP